MSGGGTDAKLFPEKGPQLNCEQYGRNPKVRKFHRHNVMHALPDRTQRLLQGLSCLPRHRAAQDCQVAREIISCSLRQAQRLTASDIVEIPRSGTFIAVT